MKQPTSLSPFCWRVGFRRSDDWRGRRRLSFRRGQRPRKRGPRDALRHAAQSQDAPWHAEARCHSSGGGTYYLPETLVLGTEDSGVTWQANEGETPVVSGRGEA